MKRNQNFILLYMCTIYIYNIKEKKINKNNFQNLSTCKFDCGGIRSYLLAFVFFYFQNKYTIIEIIAYNLYNLS
jgi:hypothetical protein